MCERITRKCFKQLFQCFLINYVYLLLITAMKSKVSFKIKQSTALLQLLCIVSQFLAQLLFCDLAWAFKPSEMACGTTVLYESKGTITSPNYPSAYPKKIDCEWKIVSPAESILRINIVDLDLVKDQPCHKTPCCSQQGLLVPVEGGRGSKLLCGNNSINETIVVSQRVTIIKYFSTSTEGHGRGFEITYSIDVRACKPHELECSNGKCVSNDSFCNNIDDCGDGSDERYCLQIMHTSSKYDFHLKKSSEIQNRFLFKPCGDGWELCPLSQNRCYLPSSHLCDEKFDCPKGEDEVGCVPSCPEQISCSSGDGCYYPSQRCNLIRNCRDNSDETGCPVEPCSAFQFTCLNGACVSGSEICNGDDDCGDLSDEENCTKSSFLTVAVMGLLSCVFLFCIGLSCLYRVYAARLRAASFAHQLEPEPIDDEFMYREPPPAYSVAVGEPGIVPYPAPQFMERYFETDQIPAQHQMRNPRHNRRRFRPPGSLSEPVSTPRSRPRPSVGVSVHNNPNVSQFPEVPHQPKNNNYSKNDPVPNRSNLDGVMELLGLQDVPQCQAYPQENNVQIRTYQNESPCSSPSLSPSRESVTSSTSLEDHEDLVQSCQS